MKKILVTGGAGYIGSVTLELMLTKGLTPVVLDNLSEGHREAVPTGVPFIKADLSDQAAVREAFRTHVIDAVIHLAALALVGESVREPSLYYRQNVGGMLNLLDAMLEAGVKRIVFSSSAATYGVPETIPIPEEAPTVPVNPYGETKLIGERMLAHYAVAHGLNSVALRYFNVAGASQNFGEHHGPETHLIPRVLQVALGQQPSAETFGTDYPTPDGTCIRDYIHVADVAEAHLLALERMGERSTVYNLGNSQGYSVREIIACAEKVTGKKIPVTELPRRPGDPPVLVASSAKAARGLGWQPRHSRLEETIESAWRWHSRHPHGYAK